MSALCRVECLQLLSLDSTNLGTAHWLQIAGAIRARYDRYDGFVISHGTDTMAYTAAALSYLIQDAAKPIILTGAQKPISFDSTDSKVNLTDAFLCACSDTLHGVMIVFNGKVIQGTRVQDALKELRGLFQHQFIRIWPCCRTGASCSISKTPAGRSRSSMTGWMTAWRC